METKRVLDFESIDESCICYYKGLEGWELFHPKVGLGNLKNHDIVEHSDGTITASPSIKISNGRGTEVHGYLRAGDWKSL